VTTDKILYVSRELPSATGPGVDRRAWQHLKGLLPLGAVTVVVPSHVAHRTQEIETLWAAGIKDLVVRDELTLPNATAAHHYAASNSFQWITRGLVRAPYFLDKASKADAARYRARIGDDFDVAFCFRLPAAIWFESVFGRPAHMRRVSDFDDIESRSFAAGTIPPPFDTRLGRLIAKRALFVLRKTERRIGQTWDHVTLCSDLDASRLGEAIGRPVAVLPNTVDFGHWEPSPASGPLNVLFVGTFPYKPNLEGVTWFVEEVWPALNSSHPGRFSLTLAGFDPPEEILALDGKDGVSVAASPPSLAPYYAAAHVVIVPIFKGSGTRIKVIEAMAKRRPVVGTTIGCEGLGLVDGEHYLDANDPSAFAAALAQLLNDPPLRTRIAETAAAHARSQFSQEEADRRLRALIAD